MTDFSETQKEFITNLFSKLNDTLNTKCEEIRNELKVQIAQIRNDLEAEVKTLQQKVTGLEEENKKLSRSIIELERKVRKNNVIIYGLPKEDNLINSTLNIFRDFLELDINADDLSNVYQINVKNSGSCPVVVEFVSFQKKLMVLNNTKKLKGKNIYINKDQCTEDRLNEKKLLTYQKEARTKGQKAYIKGTRLYIDNNVYTIDQLEEKDEVVPETGQEVEIIQETVQGLQRKKQEEEIQIRDERERRKPRPGPSKEEAKKEQKQTETKVQTRSGLVHRK